MSCFGGRDARIFSIEMLVHDLDVMETWTTTNEDRPLVIKIKFLEFPIFEIIRENFDSGVPGDSVSVGRSCLFLENPADLVRGIRTKPVKIGVFRLGDTYPIAETEILLPGCFCDQITMASNNSNAMPKPYGLKDLYGLSDPGGNSAGFLNLEMRLSCFGKSITTRYELGSGQFLFRLQDKEQAFCVKRAPMLDESGPIISRQEKK